MRASVSLNGQWKFCPAFDEISADQRWMDPDFDPDNPNLTPKTDGDVGWVAEGFDDSKWMDITVPASWNTAIDDLWSYEGHGWYRRTAFIPASWEGKRVLFNSLGSNYKTSVYVNGTLAGEHEGGYTPFDIAIHEFLRYGEENNIAVAVENLPSPDRAPGGQYGWVNHGGLYRDVSLVMTDMVYIDDVTTETVLEGDAAKLSVKVEVACCPDTEQVNQAVDVMLTDPSGKVIELPEADRTQMLHGSDGRGEVGFTIPVPDARLWSPEDPNLYNLTVTLHDTSSETPKDQWSHRIGLRTVEVRGTEFFLNGEKYFLKGLNVHELYQDTGRTFTEANGTKEIDLAKWLGANAFRGHYSFHKRHYELCDERGIINVAEVPLYMWGRPLCEADGAGALDQAKSQLHEMVKALKNHPCVLIWSISNENLTQAHQQTEEAIALAKQTADGNKEMVALAKELDSTRPIVEFSNRWTGDGDPVHDVTDITTINVYYGPRIPRSDALPDMMERFEGNLAELEQRQPDKPILIGEVGVWTVRGLKTDHPPGEYYQAKFYQHYFETFNKHPQICGAFLWILADYDLHRRFLWAHEYRPAYGLFDMRRRPKESAFAVRKMWNEEASE